MSLAEVLGYLGFVLVLLASLNGVKKYVKIPWLKSMIGYHYYFGAGAFFVLLSHFVVNLVNDNTNIFGFIALFLLLVTVGLGGAFKQKKDKKFYLFHRRVGQVMVLAVIIHVVYMWFS